MTNNEITEKILLKKFDGQPVLGRRAGSCVVAGYHKVVPTGLEYVLRRRFVLRYQLYTPLDEVRKLGPGKHVL